MPVCVCVGENTSGEYSAPSQRKEGKGNGGMMIIDMRKEGGEKKKARKTEKKGKEKCIKWLLPHYFSLLQGCWHVLTDCEVCSLKTN